MWDDVIIGKGTKFSSALKVFEIPGDHGIAQNESSFWITDCILGIGMTIYKDTTEGSVLRRVIEEKVALGNIRHWLDCVVLENIDTDKLKAKISDAIREAHRDGRRSKALEMRMVMEI